MQSSIIYGNKFRISLLTSRLIRFEYQSENKFCDHLTSLVQFRDFDSVDYTANYENATLILDTEHLHIVYNQQEFSKEGLFIQLKSNVSLYHSQWRYGESFKSLNGTARTLDEADGAIPLEHGVISKQGFSILDDSQSPLFINNTIKPRLDTGIDFYFFGYANDYQACINDFYKLSGVTPLLPRYALGNWWSRYYEYTQESYLQLMDKFESLGIPLSVAVIDMDWHPTYVDPKYGSGWTGYTWNKKLFPNPKAFMDNLHSRGMKITLNLHPADGVKPYEEAHKDMAEALGLKYNKPIDFNCNSEEFMQAYFKYLHHPHEKNGVDFWWIDWQQGASSAEGIDPLLVLNHKHYNDIKNKRALILSRYFGPGSHRYPVGFSGDTVISWESLNFQPYFTACAANIGYTWWSHDIGGHMWGKLDTELMLRWVQFGVFSPIMRLHSTKNEFNSKEPWNFDKQTQSIITEFLKLRHSLIPYIYTQNHNTHKYGRAICKPIYYDYADYEEAYIYKNQYMFGTELMVCPITQKSNSQLMAAKTKAWLPKGIWFDFFSNTMYEGNCHVELYRDMQTIPVLAKAGAIIPTTPDLNASKNPENLHIKIYAGANNNFDIYEDDDSLNADKQLITRISLNWDKQSISIEQIGDTSIIPQNRNYVLELIGFDIEALKTNADYEYKGDTLLVYLKKPCTLTFSQMLLKKPNNTKPFYTRLQKAQISFELKEKAFNIIKGDTAVSKKQKDLAFLISDIELLKYILELM